MTKKPLKPTQKNWDKVQFSKESWISFDLSGAWRTITEALPSIGYLKHWKRHMISRGFETKYKYYDSDGIKGVALLARPDFDDRSCKG